MKRILKAKHWQVFIIVLLGIFWSNFSIENSSVLTILIQIIGSVLFFIYPFFLGLSLFDIHPNTSSLNKNHFLIYSLIWFISTFAIVILSEGVEMKLNGIPAISILLLFYVHIKFLSFPSKLLKSIELDQDAKAKEYISDLILLALSPIGVWFLQPRINKIAETREKISME
jgi:hypothetical protein